MELHYLCYAALSWRSWFWNGVGAWSAEPQTKEEYPLWFVGVFVVGRNNHLGTVPFWLF